MERFRWTISPS